MVEERRAELETELKSLQTTVDEHCQALGVCVTQLEQYQQVRPLPRRLPGVPASDANRHPKIWYTKKTPKPNRYLVFLSQIYWHFLGI